MKKKEEYLTYIILILGGYSSLFFFNPKPAKLSFCFFRSITGIKCPGCGMYKGSFYLFKGNFLKAIENNIIIVFISVFILNVFVLLIIDVLFNKEYMKYFEKRILNSKVFLFFTFIFILISWYYNLLINKL